MECKNRLGELREAQGLNVPKFAVAFGVDPSTVYRWERGTTEIDDATKGRLASYFGVSIEHLMGWDRTEAKAGAA